MVVYSSTQHPGEVQHWVSHALGLDNHAVTVECRRMGGGFGGKETQAGHLAVWAAMAANKSSAPSSCGWTATTTSWSPASATRLPTTTRVGFDDTGLLTA